MTYLCCLFHKNEKGIAPGAQFRLFKKKKRVWKVYMCIFSEKTASVYGNLVKYQIVQCFLESTHPDVFFNLPVLQIFLTPVTKCILTL